MAGIQLDESTSSFKTDERNPLLPTHLERSFGVIRPCHLILQLLGVWKPKTGSCEFVWRVYRALVCVIWVASLGAVMCLDFVHYGFTTESVHVGEILNSVPTCLNLLSPFVFTLYYFNQGQYEDLVSSVQDASGEWHRKLKRVALCYTVASVVLWGLGAAFFICRWIPFFSRWWHYVIYVPAIVFTTGWWGTWLSIYGFVCHVHSLQIDIVIHRMKAKDCKSTTILYEHHEVQNSLERTQRDFNVVISFALVYHTADLIIFSFAYFHSDFGDEYQIWQYVGGVLFDLASIVIKLYSPAIVAAAVHRIVVQASKRCLLQVTPQSTELPMEDIQLLQYMVCCEPDMGLKILGIRITVELAAKLLMTIATVAVSFVAFVVPRLK